MYSIILTTILYGNAGWTQYENIAISASSVQVGEYKDAKTCEDIAKQLRQTAVRIAESPLKQIKTAQCVQVKDKP